MIEQVMSLKKRYDKMVQAFKEEDFKGWFIEFFKLYPFVTKIQWTQYAPYFNDGDPCVFAVHKPELELALSYIEKNPGLELSISEFRNDESEQYLVTYGFTKEQRKQYPDLGEAVQSLRDLFEAEDILKHVFGEDTAVCVTPEEIVCDEYEHD